MPHITAALKTSHIPLEETEQMIFVRWFHLQFPDIIIFAIPNGGYRNKKTAVKMKKSGVMPGVPDLFIPAWKLWVEMKRIKNSTTSPDQKEMMNYLCANGYECLIAKGFDDAKNQIFEWIKTNKPT